MLTLQFLPLPIYVIVSALLSITCNTNILEGIFDHCSVNSKIYFIE